ncbi:MAG: TetR/AcrR family transcriptional regulator [Verrucomicrobia bacterium]|nr:TetR/AcrR family transcriptional regulator [Verrucomicrobiota bacterium]
MAAAVQSLSRRQRLLDSASALFVRWGFDKTSVDDIARAAGISKGAVYLEFPNKDALFKATLHRELARYVADYIRRFEADAENWSYARMIQHSLAAVEDNAFVKALFLRDQSLFGRFLSRDPELFGLAISLRTELFSQLQTARAIRADVPPQTLAYIVSTTGYGLIAGSDLVPERDRLPLGDVLLAWGLLLERALAPEGPTDREAARAALVSMVRKMEAALQDLGKPSQQGNGKP